MLIISATSLMILITFVQNELLTYFTLFIRLYHGGGGGGGGGGGRGKVKLSISRKSESWNEGDVVCLQTVFDALDPSILWTSSCFIT